MTAPARNAAIDHYKFFLIACVVFGHCIQPSIGLFEVKPVFNFIYLFHMPAFVFLSGMFTRTERTGPRALQFLMLLVIFQFIYYFFAPFTGEDTHNILRPYWILWYLLCLAVWTLMAPALVKIKYALPITIVLALGAGCIDIFGYTLSLSRLFYFLPFFTAGLLYGQRLAAFVETRKTQAWIAIILCAVFAALSSGWLDEKWLYGSFSYAKLGADELHGVLTRFSIMALSSVAALSFLAVMPKEPGRFAAMGAHTLGVFLLHNFVVLPLWPALDDLFSQSVAAGYAASLILSAILVIALSRPAITKFIMLPGKIMTSGLGKR